MARVVSLFAQEYPGLSGCLNIDIHPKSNSMLQDQAKTIEGFLGSMRFAVPQGL